MEKKTAYDEIYDFLLKKLSETGRLYYFSWWLRLDMDNKYSSAKINYELSKAVKKGLLMSKSHRYGIEYSLNTTTPPNSTPLKTVSYGKIKNKMV